MLLYLLKTTFCLLLFLGFYHLVLEKEKMHRFNRFYLLGSIVFAFLVPSFIITVAPTEFVEPIAQELIINQADAINAVNEISYQSYLVGLYLLITFLLFTYFGKNIHKVLSKTRRNEKISYYSATIILLKEKVLPHTFLRYIFINKEEFKNDNSEQYILTHELAHVKQKHSLDVLFIELLQIVFWFIPIFKFYKKAVQLNHEFLADDAVIKLHENITEYQHLLLKTTAQNNNIYLASNLNYSLTKKRLLMMTTKSSRRNILLKKVAILPLLIGFIFLFAQRIEAKENIDKINDKEKIVDNTTLINTKKEEHKISSIKDTLTPPSTIKIPPPPPRKIKTGFTNSNGNTLFCVKNGKRTKYYNKFGQLTDKKAKVLSPKKVSGSDVIPEQYLTAIYKNNKVFCEFESSKTEIIETILEDPYPYPETVITEEVEENYPVILKEHNNRSSKKNGVELIHGNKYYYTIVNGTKQYFDRYGNSVNKNNLATIYYYNGKKITKTEFNQIDHHKIQKIDIKNTKNGTSEMYVTGK